MKRCKNCGFRACSEERFVVFTKKIQVLREKLDIRRESPILTKREKNKALKEFAKRKGFKISQSLREFKINSGNFRDFIPKENKKMKSRKQTDCWNCKKRNDIRCIVYGRCFGYEKEN